MKPIGIPYFNLIRTSWKYASNLKHKYIIVYAMYLLNNIVAAAHPILYGWFIDALQREGTKVLKNTWIYVLVFFLLRLVEWCFHGPARILERQLAFRISKNFMEDIYHKVLNMPIKWHQDHHSGATINKVRKAYESLKDFFQAGFVYLHSISKFLLSFAAMVYFSPLFGGIAVMLGVFTIWVIFKFDKPFVKSLKEVNKREHVVSSTLFDSLSNIMTVVTLRLEKRMILSIINKVKKVFPPFKKNVKINEWKWFTSQMLVSIIFATTVLGYTYQNYKPGEIFFMGGLVTLLIYVNQFTSVFNDIAFQYTKIVEYNTDVQMAEEILKEYTQEHLMESKNTLPHGWHSLIVRNLNFIHSNQSKTETGKLIDISIEIEKNKKIALIGESGSGKSTLLGLLRGLYLPNEGVEVIVNGEYKSDICAISNTVTLFPQDPEIFENTILYNITLGLPFTQHDVEDACKISGFYEVVQNLPNGLNTNINEKGVNLSGGQKQRLALARGILSSRNSDIILLDEPTSSVDPKTEIEIYSALFENFKNKALISSVHRLHLLSLFDHIYIMEKGKIVGSGNFKELLQNNQTFYELWKHQEYHLDFENTETNDLKNIRISNP